MKLSKNTVPFVYWPLLVVFRPDGILACTFLIFLGGLLHMYFYGLPSLLRRKKEMKGQCHIVQIRESHYCELLRWGLDALKVPYTVENHIPSINVIFHGRTVPTLITPDGATISDSIDAVVFMAAKSTLPNCNNFLLPQKESERELLKLICETIGQHARRVFYFNVFKDRKLMDDTMMQVAKNVQPWEAQLARIRPLHSIFKFAISNMLNISAKTADRSFEKLREALDTVDAKLADGRQFLSDDHRNEISLLDIAFCAAINIVAQYPTEGSIGFDVEKLPRDFREIVEHVRNRPSGKFAKLVYDLHRFK